MKKIGDCVTAMRKSLTARFMMKKFGGVRSFLLLKHVEISDQTDPTKTTKLDFKRLKDISDLLKLC